MKKVFESHSTRVQILDPSSKTVKNIFQFQPASFGSKYLTFQRSALYITSSQAAVRLNPVASLNILIKNSFLFTQPANCGIIKRPRCWLDFNQRRESQWRARTAFWGLSIIISNYANESRIISLPDFWLRTIENDEKCKQKERSSSQVIFKANIDDAWWIPKINSSPSVCHRQSTFLC